MLMFTLLDQYRATSLDQSQFYFYEVGVKIPLATIEKTCLDLDTCFHCSKLQLF